MARSTATPRALRGRWLAAATRRTFSRESYALLIEPAIADLQLEASAGTAARLGSYAAVWIGIVAACDHGMLRRARAMASDNDLLTITGLVLVHAMHSAWMIVLLLGLDGRVNLRRMAVAALTSAFAPAMVAAFSVMAAYMLYAAVSSIWVGPPVPRASITGQALE